MTHVLELLARLVVDVSSVLLISLYDQLFEPTLPAWHEHGTRA